jgi:hypothetical protein
MTQPRLLALGDSPVRLLIAIHLANILTLLGMNTLTLSSGWLPGFYGAAFIAGMVLCRHLRLGSDPHPRYALLRWDRWWIDLGFLILVGGIATSRFGYFSEAWLRAVVEPVCWDDAYHVQDVSSLVNTARFPPTSAFQPDKYFSLYYAPWMLVAFLFKAVPLWANTLKTSLAVGLAVHVLLTSYTVVYLARILSVRRTQFLLLCYLFLAYAGFESIFVFTDPGDHLEWWARRYGVDVHLPSWPQQLLWVMHHTSSAVSLVLAAWVFNGGDPTGQTRGRWPGTLTAGLLCVHAVYSSPFVVIGALPFGLAFVGWRLRARWREVGLTGGVAVASALPVLWIFLRKDTRFVLGKHVQDLVSHATGTHSPALDGVVSFLRFSGLEALDLIGYVLLLALGVRTWIRDKHDRVWVGLAVLFLVAIFFVSFSGIDNLSARGVMIPLVGLAWVAAKHAPDAAVRHPVAIAVLAILALGTANDLWVFQKRNIATPHAPAHTWSGRTAAKIYAVNSDRRRGPVDFNQLFEGGAPTEAQAWQVERVFKSEDRPAIPRDWFRSQQLIEERTNPGPFGPWAWQDWREQAPNAGH